MELPGSCPLSLVVIMELAGSCHGVAWEVSSVVKSCYGVKSCHGVDRELSLSCPWSLGVVM